MLAPATCPNCQFPITPSAVACPRCGQPVRPVDRLHAADAGGAGVANPPAPGGEAAVSPAPIPATSTLPEPTGYVPYAPPAPWAVTPPAAEEPAPASWAVSPPAEEEPPPAPWAVTLPAAEEPVPTPASWAVRPLAEEEPAPESALPADISTSSAAPPMSGLATTLPVRTRNGGEAPLPAEAAGAADALISPPPPDMAAGETATLPATVPEPLASPPSFAAWGRPAAAPPPPTFLYPPEPPESTPPPATPAPAGDAVRPPPMIYPPPVIVPPAPAPAPAEAPGVALRPANAATTGALVLLPQEEVVTQLGALYLTSKRVILYAPTILRAAFIRDVDAVGTVTERASGWSLFFALLVLAVAGVLTYLAILQNQLSASLSGLYQFPLWLIILVLAILGGTLLATYFFWVKKSLFLSVGGRPLIVISLSGWTAKRLEGVDSFVNAFSQIKDVVEYPRD